MSYRFTTDRDQMDADLIHSFITEAYWAKGRSKQLVKKTIANSLCFGLFTEGGENKQVAFGRFVTDYAVFAYLADVFVLPEYQGQGLAKLMMEKSLQHPDIKDLKRIMLATSTAHGLYKKYGFESLKDPDLFMLKESS